MTFRLVRPPGARTVHGDDAVWWDLEGYGSRAEVMDALASGLTHHPERRRRGERREWAWASDEELVQLSRELLGRARIARIGVELHRRERFYEKRKGERRQP